jgi:hypothetical protein
MKKMFLKKLFFFEKINGPFDFLNKNGFLKKNWKKIYFFYKKKFSQINISILYIIKKKKKKNSCLIFIYGTMKKVVLFFIVWIFFTT